jgi:hypothetical protein
MIGFNKNVGLILGFSGIIPFGGTASRRGPPLPGGDICDHL